ncbi:hypothetical protein GEMRC1_002445 [Eukaryota sp. GEM-RC1]
MPTTRNSFADISWIADRLAGLLQLDLESISLVLSNSQLTHHIRDFLCDDGPYSLVFSVLFSESQFPIVVPSSKEGQSELINVNLPVSLTLVTQRTLEDDKLIVFLRDSLSKSIFCVPLLSATLVSSAQSILSDVFLQLFPSSPNLSTDPSASSDMIKSFYTLLNRMSTSLFNQSTQVLLPKPETHAPPQNPRASLVSIQSYSSAADQGDRTLRQWIEVVTDFITETNIDSFGVVALNNREPGPLAEIEYWKQRHAIAQGFLDQLKERELKSFVASLISFKSKMIKEWKTCESMLYETFSELKETHRIILLLEKSVLPYYSENLNFASGFGTLFSVVRSLYFHTRVYNNSRRISQLLNRISLQIVCCCRNSLLKMTVSHKRPPPEKPDLIFDSIKQFPFNSFGQLFSQPLESLLTSLATPVSLSKLYRQAFEYSQSKGSDGNLKPLPVNDDVVLGPLTKFISRCQQLIEVCKVLVTFSELIQKSEYFKKFINPCTTHVYDVFLSILTRVEEDFNNFNETPVIDRDVPDIAGSIVWSKRLLDQVEGPVNELSAIQALFEQDQFSKIIKLYNKLGKVLVGFETAHDLTWQRNVDLIKSYLNIPLLTVVDDGTKLLLNFPKNISQLLKEAQFIQSHGLTDVPKFVLDLLVTLKPQQDLLKQLLIERERVLSRVLSYSVPILTPYLLYLDEKTTPGLAGMTWIGLGISDYLTDLSSAITQIDSALSQIELTVKDNCKDALTRLLDCCPLNSKYFKSNSSTIDRPPSFDELKNRVTTNTTEFLIKYKELTSQIGFCASQIVKIFRTDTSFSNLCFQFSIDHIDAELIVTALEEFYLDTIFTFFMNSFQVFRSLSDSISFVTIPLSFDQNFKVTRSVVIDQSVSLLLTSVDELLSVLSFDLQSQSNLIESVKHSLQNWKVRAEIVSQKMIESMSDLSDSLSGDVSIVSDLHSINRSDLVLTVRDQLDKFENLRCVVKMDSWAIDDNIFVDYSSVLSFSKTRLNLRCSLALICGIVSDCPKYISTLKTFSNLILNYNKINSIKSLVTSKLAVQRLVLVESVIGETTEVFQVNDLDGVCSFLKSTESELVCLLQHPVDINFPKFLNYSIRDGVLEFVFKLSKLHQNLISLSEVQNQFIPILQTAAIFNVDLDVLTHWNALISGICDKSISSLETTDFDKIVTVRNWISS